MSRSDDEYWRIQYWATLGAGTGPRASRPEARKLAQGGRAVGFAELPNHSSTGPVWWSMFGLILTLRMIVASSMCGVIAAMVG